jgi:hypothetical protein
MRGAILTSLTAVPVLLDDAIRMLQAGAWSADVSWALNAGRAREEGLKGFVGNIVQLISPGEPSA